MLISKKNLVFLTIALVYSILQLFVIFSSNIRGEVWYVNMQAIDMVIHLKNPYTEIFKQIELKDVNYTIPDERDLYSYLPFTILFLIPFYSIGEIAIGGVVANLLTAFSIFYISQGLSARKRFSLHISAITTIIYLAASFDYLAKLGNSFWGFNGMTTGIGVAFLMLSLYMLGKNKNILSGILYGISLASLQFSLFVVPFFFFYPFKKRQLLFILSFLISALIIILPFLLPNPIAMLNDTFGFGLNREIFAFPLNLGLNGILQSILGIQVPLFLRITIVSFSLIFLLKGYTSSKTSTYKKLLLHCSIFSAICLFLIPNNLFQNYLLFPLAIFLPLLSAASFTLIKRTVLSD